MNPWDDLTNTINMHDLYLEFAEAELTRDDNGRGRAHLYHKKENDIPQCLKRNPRGAATFSFERMRFSNVCNLDSFKQAKLDKCANVEVLKVDHCDALQSLDINGLEELRSLELMECPNLEHLQGLENRDKLEWMRWDPCHAKVVDCKLLTSLQVLQLTWVSHSTTIDLRKCHNLQELSIRYILIWIEGLSFVSRIQEHAQNLLCRLYGTETLWTRISQPRGMGKFGVS